MMRPGKLERVIVGCIFTLLPATFFGLMIDLLFGFWVAVAAGLFFLGLGLDIVFNPTIDKYREDYDRTE